MAETFTQDGLAFLYSRAINGSTQNTYFSVTLFVSATPTTVPASTASAASNGAFGWTEMTASTGSYTRQNVAASAIASPAVIGSSAVGSTWPAVSFTGFTSSSPANGFVVLSSSVGSSASPIAFANFDSGASRALVTVSDTLNVTPTLKALP